MPLVAMLLLAFLLSLAGPQALAAAMPPGELLVKWRSGPESAEAIAGNQRIGTTVRRNFPALGWQEIALPAGMDVARALEAYQSLEGVLAAEPNRVVSILSPPPAPISQPEAARSALASTSGVIPNDPQLRLQWYLAKIGATNAWQVTTGSSNVVVVVPDTGVDYRHPDLAANMWQNPGESGLDANGHDKATNGIDDDGNGYVDDVFGINATTGSGDPTDLGFFSPGQSPVYHGTACAGVIGAVGNNGRNTAGVNWNVRIMAIRSYGDLSVPFPSMVSHWIATWDYIVMMKRRGVNIRVTSLSVWSNDWERPVRDAIAAAGREGILNVAIAGNSPYDQDLYPISFPGAHDEPSILSVAATTPSDVLTDFSGFGRSTVDLAAPGIDMIVLKKGGGTEAGWQGTSFACPQVAGAAALLLAAYPTLSRDELRAALLGSVDHPSALKGKVVTGGRLNVNRALHSVTNPEPPAIVIYASPAGRRSVPELPLTVTFSRPMERSSVEAALVIEPALRGTFEWLDGDRTFRFHHDTPFDMRTNYTVRLLGSAHDAAGGGLDGNFNQAREGSPADDYLWGFRFPVAGDDFASALPVAGEAGSISGSTFDASAQQFELAYAGVSTLGSTVWYRWTAPPQGAWSTFDLTTGTGFDSVLAVVSGVTSDHLQEAAGNDNYGTRGASRVSLFANPGQTYSIVVASKATQLPDLVDSSKAGKFTLRWYPTPTPGFTGGQFSPTQAALGAKVTLTGTNFTGATAVLFNGASATFTNAATNFLDLRITAIVPPDARSGPITVVTPHGTVTSTVVFEVQPPPLLATVLPGGDIGISWGATGPDFLLEATAELSSSAALWVPVSAAPVVAGDRTTVRVSPAAATARFFRLRNRPGG